MYTEKDLVKYVNVFGEKLIDDVINKIRENDWIASGNLLNTLEFTTSQFKDKVIGELNIAGYYQFLKDNKRKTSGTQTKKINARTNIITNKAYVQNLKVPDNKTTFLTPILKQDIEYFNQVLIPEIEKDVTKIITDSLNKL